MKNVMYGSVAILALALAFHLGATTANSTYVDPADMGVIAVWGNPGTNPRVLDENGVLWVVDENFGWLLSSEVPPPPMPVNQITFWDPGTIVTVDDHVWRRPGGSGDWVDCGAWPGSGSPVEQTSWGRIKASYTND